MRRRRPSSQVNFTFQADIGLMLLLFFLVTTYFRKPETGVSERLLPWFESSVTQSYPAELRLLLSIDEDDLIRHNGRVVAPKDLPIILEGWYLLYGSNPAYHVTLEYSSYCTFKAYLGVKDAILNAHRSLRRQQALMTYGSNYRALPREQRNAIIERLPLRLSETTRIWRAEGEREDCDVLVYPF